MFYSSNIDLLKNGEYARKLFFSIIIYTHFLFKVNEYCYRLSDSNVYFTANGFENEIGPSLFSGHSFKILSLPNRFKTKAAYFFSCLYLMIIFKTLKKEEL